MSIIVRSARNFSVQIAQFGVTILDRVLLTALLIRGWGVDTFSDWATINSFIGLLVIADLGFQTYLGNVLSRAGARGRLRAFSRIVAYGLVFYAGVAALLLVLIVTLFGIFDLHAVLSLRTDDLALTFVVLAIQQTLRIVRSAVTQIYRGMGDFHWFLYIDLRATGVGLTAGAVAVAFGASPLVVALLYLASEVLLGSGAALLHVRKRYPALRMRFRFPTLQRVRLTARALRWYGLDQILNYTVLNIPVLIIAWLGLGGPLLVTFVLQRTLVNVARTAGQNLSIAAGVELSRLAQSGSRNIRPGVEALVRVNAALAGLMTSGLVAYGAPIVGLWTGRPELGSLTVLSWLLLPVIALAPATPLKILLLYGDRMRPQALAGIIQVCIVIPGCVMAGAAYGIVGIAATLAIGEIVAMAIVSPILAARAFALDYGRLVLLSAVVFAMTLGWSALVAWLALLPPLPAHPAFVLVRIAGWALFAGLPVMVFCLPKAVRALLLEMAGSAFSKARA